MKWIWVVALAVFACRAADLDAVRSEPDLEKRSDRALDLAEKSLGASRDLYSTGDYKKALAGLEEIRQSVDLARDSLVESHKSARKSKYFKRAELRTRGLSRHLEEFARECAVDDRPPVEALVAHVNQFHDDLLSMILEKKK